MQQVNVVLGDLLFEFTSFGDWTRNAQRRFKAHNAGSTTQGHVEAVCIDAKDRVCNIGREFMRARDEEAFPIRVYRMTF